MNQASLHEFGGLITAIDRCNKTNTKISLISGFIENIDPRDGCWTLCILLNQRKQRLITGQKLRRILNECTSIPSWLLDDCFTQVGDSAETLSLLWPQIKPNIQNIEYKFKDATDEIYSTVKTTDSLHLWMETVLPLLKNKTDAEQRHSMIELWKNIPDDHHYLVNKLITGGFRIGVSKGLVVKSIAQAYEINESTVIERLMKSEATTQKWFKELVKPRQEEEDDRGAIPYPFYLASPVNLEQLKVSPVQDWSLECKWDGIRGQLIRRQSGIFLWSRGEELINISFPEIINLAEKLPYGTVLDGEIICWRDGAKQPMTFASLQKRLGRKSITKLLLQECPVKFVAYDLIEHESKDQRRKPLNERKKILEVIHRNLNHNDLVLGECKTISNWSELEKARDETTEQGAEGLMIKKIDSIYLSGRRRGSWWKYKHDPMTLDVVLIYAQAGTGKRANLFTDYTFALWDEPRTSIRTRKLITFAKAYSGLKNDEIIHLDRWIRKHTIERFGPTRVVEQKQVFEIAFEGVMESKRHKCGLAVRFPRILRWRVDKKAEEADCLEHAQAHCKKD